MLIKNPDAVPNKFSCNVIIADYLTKKGNPILSIKDKSYYFSKTKKLEEDLKNIPFYIKASSLICAFKGGKK